MMPTKTLPAAALVLAFALTGCTASPSTSTQPSASVSASTSASADTAQDAPEVDRDPQGTLPEITFSSKGIPSMKKLSAEAPKVISVKTLKAGAGAVVAAGDYVKVNYAGFLWKDGTQFDSSYESGTPAGFALGQVVQGWKYGLAGTKVGDRLELIVPPDYGYGDQEQESIPAGSTLVFVVDVLASTSVTTDALTSATVTKETLPAGITVSGELGHEPTLTITADAAKPTESKTVLLAEGKGATITATDTLLYHIVASEWGGESSSSWDSSYQQTDSGGGDITVGKKVGSRLLLLYPADEEGGTAAQAYVIDILTAIPAE